MFPVRGVCGIMEKRDGAGVMSDAGGRDDDCDSCDIMPPAEGGSCCDLRTVEGGTEGSRPPADCPSAGVGATLREAVMRGVAQGG